MKRKIQLAEGQVYHVFNRSIAHFQIFNEKYDSQRMLHLFKYFQVKDPPMKFSYFNKLDLVKQNGFYNYLESLNKGKLNIVQIIAYSTMPTHIHLILKQLEPNGISLFMSNVLNSYSRYFNTKHKRKGPLWESKFQNVLVDTDEQLLHLTRYLHLNAVTAKLVEHPQDWEFSSYNEYISKDTDHPLCDFHDLLTIVPKEYKKFVNDRIGYQRELSIIKKYLIDKS